MLYKVTVPEQSRRRTTVKQNDRSTKIKEGREALQSFNFTSFILSACRGNINRRKMTTDWSLLMTSKGLNLTLMGNLEKPP